LDEAKNWSGKYYITFTACFLFVVKFWWIYMRTLENFLKHF
jgi:hypothetical protein